MMKYKKNIENSFVKITILGPSLSAVSGVSTHLNLLFSSVLSSFFRLSHYQVGRQGTNEGRVGTIFRLIYGPFGLFFHLLSFQPNIVHLNTSLDLKGYWRDFVFLLIAKSLNKRIVLQKHGGPLPQNFFSRHRALSRLFRWSFLLPDAVIVLSKEEEEAYRSFIPGQRIELIPNAITTDNLVARTLELKQNDQLHLIYVGRLVENKGLFEALEALARLNAMGRFMRLTFAGDGSDFSRLKDLAQSLGISSSVYFAGPVFGADKDALWHSADVFVFPSYYEGLPYALLEAMAAGVVPVTTVVGAIPDVMRDGVEGLFVPAKDVDALVQALIRLDDDRGLLLKLARAGRERVLENYSASRLEADFKRLYASLASSSNFTKQFTT